MSPSRVSLHAPDSLIPNLAMMKLSAWHRQQGDDVWINTRLADPTSDLIYVSYVFTNSVRDHDERATVGGIGTDNRQAKLSEQAEHILPDYDAWGCGYSMGLTSRGCPNSCPWCFVPEAEGKIVDYADPDSFVRVDHDHVMLLDNNLLAAPGAVRVLEWAGRFHGSVDFNTGLDTRRIDRATAKLLSKVKIRPWIRLACDSEAGKKPLVKAMANLESAGIAVGQRRTVVCVLVGFSGELSEEDIERTKFVDGIADAFVMPYMPPDAGPGWRPDERIRAFARWCNRKEFSRTVAWEDYDHGYGKEKVRQRRIGPDGPELPFK